ncbi:MAG: hypothetical protein NTY29_10085 [Proteobacteria bacterium]|nr:hypothetical protein [Pseudomonadota bacterium]
MGSVVMSKEQLIKEVKKLRKKSFRTRKVRSEAEALRGSIESR